MEGFTKHELKGANLAHKAQAILGQPTSKELSQVVSSNFGINNCPVNPIDIANADVIYGPDLGSVRGKTVRRKPECVRGGKTAYQMTSTSCVDLCHFLQML